MDCKLVVGQHVACVDRPISHGMTILTPHELPIVGTVYTVRQVTVSADQSTIVISLLEIPDTVVEVVYNGMLWKGTLAFLASSFKPLDRLKVEDFVGELEPV